MRDGDGERIYVDLHMSTPVVNQMIRDFTPWPHCVAHFYTKVQYVCRMKLNKKG